MPSLPCREVSLQTADSKPEQMFSPWSCLCQVFFFFFLVTPTGKLTTAHKAEHKVWSCFCSPEDAYKEEKLKTNSTQHLLSLEWQWAKWPLPQRWGSWTDLPMDSYLRSLCCGISSLAADRIHVQSLMRLHPTRRPVIHLCDDTDPFPLRKGRWFILQEINTRSGFSFVFHVCRAPLGQTA